MDGLGTDYRLDIVFEHYGADPDVMMEKGKDDRNLRLLELKLEEPDDLSPGSTLHLNIGLLIVFLCPGSAERVVNSMSRTPLAMACRSFKFRFGTWPARANFDVGDAIRGGFGDRR